MSLVYLVHRGATYIDEIAAYLDGLSADHRRHEVRQLGRAAQERLYELAAAAPPITLEHFVPTATSPLTEVIHDGKNTLPALQTFQKRFCRPAGDGGRLFGYNEGVTRPVLGPGFFVAHPTAGNAEWERRGAVVVDYYLVPDGEVAPGWPRVVPNTHGLQVLVYHQTRDFMRRVSTHVSIGAAYKGEKKLGAYFALCRHD
ncbi:MAG: hypothetical protein HY906_08450 [Deltaproteobacteria bacterium]|nr:hypothetical protein [Deltaproteobacteria bacterium]